MRLHRFIYFLLLFAAPVVHAQQALDQARADVEYLTSSELKGRGYLHDGHLKAAAYIRQRFQSIGLDTFPGGYYQSFGMRANVFPEAASLTINGVALEPGRQFIPHEASGSGSSHGELRWSVAGSGLVVPGNGIDDYDGAYPRGTIAIIDQTVSEKFRTDTTIDRDLLSLDGRIQVASLLGARGIIVVCDRLTFSISEDAFDIPVFSILRGALPDSIISLSFSVVNRVDEITTQNVVGYIRGTEHPDSLLVLCAHYDHLGAIGDTTFFPGANDNASGTAMLLSFADYFRLHPPGYSVAFITFSGEEAGLRGSRYFAEHPLFNLSRVRFLLNMDMAASGGDGITAVGGEVFGEEFAMLKNAAEDEGVKDVRKREVAPNSDHYPIVRKGVRGFYVYPFTGLQPYHHVDDRPATLQWDVFMRLRLIFMAFLKDLQKE